MSKLNVILGVNVAEILILSKEFVYVTDSQMPIEVHLAVDSDAVLLAPSGLPPMGLRKAKTPP